MDSRSEVNDSMPRDSERTKRYLYWNMIGVFAASYDLSIREALDMFKVADIREKIDSGYTYLAHRSYSDAVSLIGGVMSRKGIELPELKKDPMKALFGRENVRIVWFLIKTAPLHFPFPFFNHPYLRIHPWFLSVTTTDPYLLIECRMNWIGNGDQGEERCEERIGIPSFHWIDCPVIESFDSYVFDREGCEDEGSFQ